MDYYANKKAKLRETFEKILNHPSYKNKTYEGENFAEALRSFEDAWFDILNYLTVNPDPHSVISKQLDKWLYWDHEFNRGLMWVYMGNDPFPFGEAVDFLMSVAQKFLDAETVEEEVKALNESFLIVSYQYGSKDYKFKKKIWLTEELLGTKSVDLPKYFFIEIENVKKDEKYYEDFKAKYDKWSMPASWLEEMVSDEREYWRLYELAVEKGFVKEIADA